MIKLEEIMKKLKIEENNRNRKEEAINLMNCKELKPLEKIGSKKVLKIIRKTKKLSTQDSRWFRNSKKFKRRKELGIKLEEKMNIKRKFTTELTNSNKTYTSLVSHKKVR